MAESVGGVGWRCLLAESVGGVCWRCRLAVSVGGVSWRTAPVGATPRIGAGGVCWRCLLAVSAGGPGYSHGDSALTHFPRAACRRTRPPFFELPSRLKCLAAWLGRVGWRCRLAESLVGVSWRTGLQPGRFRLNSFPANRLQAKPTDVFRIAIPAQVLGGLAWRSRLAVSAGGVGWRSQLAESVGGVSWRSQLAVSVGGVSWRCQLADRVTARAVPS